MKKNFVAGILVVATLAIAATFSQHQALAAVVDSDYKATVEVTVVESTVPPEEPDLNAPNTGAVTILGKELSQQDLTTLIVATVMIIACGVTAILSYRTNKKGGHND